MRKLPPKKFPFPTEVAKKQNSEKGTQVIIERKKYEKSTKFDSKNKENAYFAPDA